MSFAVGSLVKARGREWVVLPAPAEPPHVLVLRPLGGTDVEVTGIDTRLEKVAPATFALPSATDAGDHRSGQLLRDAIRLSVRTAAGPFRSLGRVAIEPRPYQLVPLLMALRLDPVRLLIADDVGIGKTIEACLIARELLDRGEIARMTVLCPPHLAEQWQRALDEQFQIDARLVLPGTVARLERGTSFDESLFERHPFTVVSLDYIKQERRRAEFLRAAPELVIVDEAHTCADAGMGRGARHLRHQLLRQLSLDESRHMLLVTATPHSGKDDAFRSLLTLLDPHFRDLPEDLGGDKNRRHREHLARHFVLRQRIDIEKYLGEDTPFPQREDRELPYTLSKPAFDLLNAAIEWARDAAQVSSDDRTRRVHWWSAIALLRSVSSSPAAAAGTMLRRSNASSAESVDEVDEQGRRAVFDGDEDDSLEGTDSGPGADPRPLDDGASSPASAGSDAPLVQRLRHLAAKAKAIATKDDAKLQALVGEVKKLLREGFSPIVFCRFVETAEYVAGALRTLIDKVAITAVTGQLEPDEREKRIEELGAHDKRVLVATDCLSEGINLQQWFDAVVHYDLAWNPTRHEQREGRVDRYGQPRATVKVVTLYGRDNPVDGIVLDVLLRKHKAIRKTLGISVPVPASSDEVLGAVLEGVLMRGRAKARASQASLPLDFGPDETARRESLHQEWTHAGNREKRTRSLFQQEGIKVDAVKPELDATREAIGTAADVDRFLHEALALFKGHIEIKSDRMVIDLRDAPRAVRDALQRKRFEATFRQPAPRGVEHLHRRHPIVEALASHVLDTALDGEEGAPVRRGGVTRSKDVPLRSTLLVLRLRHSIREGRARHTAELLAEECCFVAFQGAPTRAEWLDEAGIKALVNAKPSANVQRAEALEVLGRVLGEIPAIDGTLNAVAKARAKKVQDSHARVREASGNRRGVVVEPHLPVDIVGVYVFLPAPGGRA